jgi:hypothetical protein
MLVNRSERTNAWQGQDSRNHQEPHASYGIVGGTISFPVVALLCMTARRLLDRYTTGLRDFWIASDSS